MPGINKVGQWVIPTHTIANAPPLDVLLVVGGVGSRAILNGLLGPSVKFIADVYPSLQYLLVVCTGNALAAASVGPFIHCLNQRNSNNVIGRIQRKIVDW
jgi:putative intracellular protease/amidase